MSRDVAILDCTLRDGSYARRFTADDTRALCAALEKAGFPYVEVGNGMGLGASRVPDWRAEETDEEYLRAARGVLKRSKLGCFCWPGVGTGDDLRRARDAGMDFVRFGIYVSDVAPAEPMVALAGELGLEVSFNFVKTDGVDVGRFVETALRVDGWKVDTLCVVDTAGSMVPEQVKSYIAALRERTSTRLGFHGHNNLQLAVANSVAAVEAGATVVDSTLRGVGRSSGNTPSEILVPVLRRLGYAVTPDIFDTLDAAELLPPHQGGGARDIACGVGRFASSFGHLIDEACRRFPDVDPRRLTVSVGERNAMVPTIEDVSEVARKLSRNGGTP